MKVPFYYMILISLLWIVIMIYGSKYILAISIYIMSKIDTLRLNFLKWQMLRNVKRSNKLKAKWDKLQKEMSNKWNIPKGK